MLSKIRYFCLGMLLVAALAMTPFRVVVVTGNSMAPTLKNGESYLMDQFYWKSGGLRRNDIVVVRHGEEKWVKRLIGMPGDDLQLSFADNGWIVHVGNLTVNPSLRREDGNVEVRHVEPGEIFVIGDNLNQSADSTTQEHGSFKLNDVMGIVRTYGMNRDFPFRQPASGN